MPQTDHGIELGDRVKDHVSGFTGIVCTVGYHITGCTRFGVYPSPDDGEETHQRGEEEFFYENQLAAVNGKAMKGTDTVNVEEIDIELGERVQDDITGFEGVAVVINTLLWNCPQVAVQRQIDEPDEEPTVAWFDLPRLSVVDEGVSGEYQVLQEDDVQKATGATVDKPSSSLDSA